MTPRQAVILLMTSMCLAADSNPKLHLTLRLPRVQEPSTSRKCACSSSNAGDTSGSSADDTLTRGEQESNQSQAASAPAISGASRSLSPVDRSLVYASGTASSESTNQIARRDTEVLETEITQTMSGTGTHWASDSATGALTATQELVMYLGTQAVQTQVLGFKYIGFHRSTIEVLVEGWLQVGARRGSLTPLYELYDSTELVDEACRRSTLG